MLVVLISKGFSAISLGLNPTLILGSVPDEEITSTSLKDSEVGLLKGFFVAKWSELSLFKLI